MCGILGYFSKYDIADSKFHNLRNATNYLKERGPDYLGVIKKKNFFLSNSRLKIVSKKNYDLPLYKHKNYISFSGEILNYKELKNFLKNKNYKFFTDTDTEVILSMYDYHGVEFVNYLKGFFSICIFDTKNNLVVLAVDRIGNKSIFYNFSNNNFLFSSQQSYLLKSKLLEFDVNKKKIDEYLVFGDISGDQTLHQNIQKMIPGQIIIYNFSSLKKYFYYELDKKIINKNNKKKLDLNKSVIEVKNSLKNSIDLWQNNCAYEKSILLSGGIDSGLLAMILADNSKKINSFTVNFFGGKNIKKLNELDEVNKITKKFKIQNKLINFKKENMLENLTPIYSNFEEPLPSSSLLLKQISKFVGNISNNRICFTGDGADEIFGGYIRHHVIKKQYEKNLNLNTIALGFNYLTVGRLKKYFNKSFKIPNERINFLSKLKNLSTLDKILLNDVKFYLPIFLRSTEIIGMNSSIEYRSPFTDHNLIEKSFYLKDQYRINKTFGKIVLKKIFCKYLKKKFKKKSYFSTPFLNEQFKNGICSEYINELNNNSKISNYFSVQKIKKLLQDHKRIDHTNTLMRLLTLELFLQSK